jgi:hypothetical protein
MAPETGRGSPITLGRLGAMFFSQVSGHPTYVNTACNEKGAPADGMIAARSPIGTSAHPAGSSKSNFLQFGTMFYNWVSC